MGAYILHMKCAAVLKSLFGNMKWFGIPGGAIGSFCAEIHNQAIYAKHETQAVFMACGYWQANRQFGNLPGVFTTSGPGIFNAITGLAAAKTDGFPLVFVAGDVPTTKYGKKALQEGSGLSGSPNVDQILGQVCKKVVRLTYQDLKRSVLSETVRKLMQTATAIPMGPVALILPLDVANGEVEEHSDYEKILQKMKHARKPVCVVGSGCSDAERLLPFLKKLGFPIILTPKAKALVPEGFPGLTGIFGYGGHPSATKLLEQGVDVGLFLGCGLDEVSTNGWSPLLQPECMICVNPVKPPNYKIDHWIRVMVELFIDDIIPDLPIFPQKQLTQTIERTPFDCDEQFNHVSILTSLQAHYQKEKVDWYCDIGEHLLFVLHYLQCKKGDTFTALLTTGSMGSGIGTAIGAAAANKSNRKHICFIGDYGMQMFGQELATAVANNLDLVIVVFNDSTMTMVKNGQESLYNQEFNCLNTSVAFDQIAKAQNANGIAVTNETELKTALEHIDQLKGPCVIDARIKSFKFPNNARFASLGGFAAK